MVVTPSKGSPGRRAPVGFACGRGVVSGDRRFGGFPLGLTLLAPSLGLAHRDRLPLGLSFRVHAYSLCTSLGFLLLLSKQRRQAFPQLPGFGSEFTEPARERSDGSCRRRQALRR